MKQPIEDRIARHIVVVPSGCWIWTGTRVWNGYGRIQVGNKCQFAHRVSYETFVGPIPAGRELDHLCRERGCVNWRHLEPVTRRENQRRAATCIPTVNAAKTHCRYGHEFTPENTWVSPRGGGRVCKACQGERSRRWREKVDPERLRAYARKSYHKDPEAKRAAMRERYHADIEKSRARQRKSAKQQRDKRRANSAVDDLTVLLRKRPAEE